MAFQIVDDILDVVATDEQLGKPAGHDLVEGVYTLPVLRTLALGDGVGDELRVAARPARSTSPSGTRRWRSCARNEGVESAVATARQYVAAAEPACDDLPPGAATDALRAAPAASSKRHHPPEPRHDRATSRRSEVTRRVSGGLVAAQGLARSVAWSTIGAG